MGGEMAVREFIFFDQQDHPLFVRTDAEQANWQVDELSLVALFPFDPAKKILRGMRVGFEDDDGVLQPFEVRKVKTYEPDHYQEITCEHIVISELTDVHITEQELTNVTPQAALIAVLAAQSGSPVWSVGNVTATATSSGDITLGSVWQNIRTVEQNWNVYIIPRVTFNSSGITGRYLDIIPAGGTWRGLRLSLDKNADEVGVTYDDTNVVTALYGYGGTAYVYNDPTHGTDPLDKKGTKIDLKNAAWPTNITPKPSNANINTSAGYIEDTTAKAAYGRNGKNRFGFYQNADITDQGTLCLKTWEALQASNKPVISIDCMVRDLRRLGYADQPIRLHDTALVEILPIGEVLRLEVIKLAVDLLDPTATRPTIGQYIPNIVYIQRQTAWDAAGGASRTISGRRGGGASGGQTKAEAEWSEFRTGIDANNMIISLHAEQVNTSNEILKQAAVAVESGGVLIYAGNNLTDMKGEITVNSNSITQIVTAVGDDGEVTAASIVLAINDSESTVTIDADHIKIGGTSSSIELGTVLYQNSDGYAELNAYKVQCVTAQATNVYANYIQAPGSSTAGTQLRIDADVVQSKNILYEKSDGNGTDLKNSFVSVTDGQYVNNSKTVTFTKADGNTATITFSRATTLLGEWSSGVFTVVASPQGNVKFTSLTQGTASWNDKTVTIPIYATIDTSATPVYTGKSVTATYSGGSGSHDITFGSTSTSVPSGYGSSPAKTVTAGTGSNHFYFTVTCGDSKKYVQIDY